jgi:hypothetical protein
MTHNSQIVIVQGNVYRAELLWIPELFAGCQERSL